MRQVWITRHGAPEVLQVRQVPDPSPARGEVRVQVAFAGVNYAEVMMRIGLYPDAGRPPLVPGFEVAGKVDAVGDGVDVALLGRRVTATTRSGGYSDQVCVSTANLMPTPDTVTDEAAAALPVNYLTAHHMLVHVCGLREGETVLVHSAAGGVGTAVVQLCGILGARVIGTASRGKHDFLRSLGVEPVDSGAADWPERVRAASGERGVDVALDAVGGASFRRSYELLAPAGRLCCFGASSMSGRRRNLLRAVRELLRMHRFHPVRLMNDNRGVHGIALGHLWEETEILAPQLDALVAHAAAGRIDPVIDGVYSFEQAAEAHRRLQSRESVGKILLAP
jgi:NADPH:quinone reductase-like Zn-dependent oxidoreductase